MLGTDEWRPILTDRLLLRRLTMDDLSLMVRLNTDPLVLRYLDNTVPTSSEVENQVREVVARYGDDPVPGRLVAFLRADGAFVGRFSLYSSGRESGMSVGYRLLPEFWNLGLATEGTQALIAYGFTMPGIERIRAQTMFVNAASRRVMEKSGMCYLWTFHPHFDDPLPGTELGEVEYGITREEWQAARAG